MKYISHIKTVSMKCAINTFIHLSSFMFIRRTPNKTNIGQSDLSAAKTTCKACSDELSLKHFTCFYLHFYNRVNIPSVLVAWSTPLPQKNYTHTHTKLMIPILSSIQTQTIIIELGIQTYSSLAQPFNYVE